MFFIYIIKKHYCFLIIIAKKQIHLTYNIINVNLLNKLASLFLIWIWQKQNCFLIILAKNRTGKRFVIEKDYEILLHSSSEQKKTQVGQFTLTNQLVHVNMIV